jgi:hypothetical protein
MDPSVYLGFTNDANRHTRNLASTSWGVYSPEGQLVSSGGICIRP